VTSNVHLLDFNKRILIGRLNKKHNRDEVAGVFIQHGESLKQRRGFLFNAAIDIGVHVVSGILEHEGGNGPYSSTKCGHLLA
jgi:hypothetical protein